MAPCRGFAPGSTDFLVSPGAPVVLYREVPMAKKHPHRPSTPSDIVQILGPIDDRVIAQIVGVQATAEEVDEPFRRWRGYCCLSRLGSAVKSGRKALPWSGGVGKQREVTHGKIQRMGSQPRPFVGKPATSQFGTTPSCRSGDRKSAYSRNSDVRVNGCDRSL